MKPTKKEIKEFLKELGKFSIFVLAVGTVHFLILVIYLIVD
tara:strand:+ start:2597 stop:2719 length:123 start_codon:yes stop_codon:yes gene_type:complete